MIPFLTSGSRSCGRTDVKRIRIRIIDLLPSRHRYLDPISEWVEPLVARVLNAFAAESLCVTVISVEEQLDGRHAFMRRAKTDAQLACAYQNLTDSVRVLSGIHIVTFSEAAIARYNMLLAMKLNVGKMDLRIAVIALEEGATIITRNLRDFQRVPGLICENWAD